jgi:tetratricopeptide (TPR) repeat protein
MLKRFQIFLGPRNFKAFVALLALTGLGSLILNVIEGEFDWVVPVQTVLVIIFLLGAAYLIMSRLPSEERNRWLGILIPAILAMLVGWVVLPHLAGLFVGAAVGWIFAGIFLFNSFGAPQNYKRAIKAMRKQEYGDAVEAMTELIKAEPKQAEHYRFRAELFRLWGKIKLARKDYLKMIELEDDSAVAYNGLAEVELQAKNYEKALDAAHKAHELAPDEWVAVYNVGMIEDRLKQSQHVIDHLDKALELKIPDSRHRLLVHFWRLRAYKRLGEDGSAQGAFDAMTREKSGLEEWQTIMSADEAKALRDVLEDDITLINQLIDRDKTLDDLVAGVR